MQFVFYQADYLIMPKRLDIDAMAIEKKYADGRSINYIADYFDVSRSVIRRRLKESNVELRKKKDIDVTEVADLYLSEKTSEQIARMLGVSQGKILNILRKLNIRRRNKYTCKIPNGGLALAKTTYRNKKWLEKQYWDLNKTHKEIADECFVGPSTIRSWMHKNNIAIRTRGESAVLNAKHFDPTDEVINFIDGLLLGDGHVTKGTSATALYEHSEKHEDYLRWLSGKFEAFGIKQTGRIRSHNFVSNGYQCNGFQFATNSYAEFLEIRKRWYVGNKKIVPKDLVLNPTVCTNWMIGDGTVKSQKRGRGHIVLCTCGFAVEEVEMLIDKLSNIGINGSRFKSNNTIYLGPDSSIKFLDYIGPLQKELAAIYGYKEDLTNSKKEWEAEHFV